MTRSIVRKSAIAATAFFGTLGVLSVGYSAYSWLSVATAWTPLTVGLWTQVKDNFDDLNSRLSNFSFSSGKIGIGTSAPEQPLHVSAAGTAAQLVLERTGASAGKMAVGADSSGFSVFDTPGYTRHLTVSSAGNVGIGTATPAAKLQVSGPMIRTIAYASANGPTDEKDSWQIASRVLTFNKLSASTKIRIQYTDALRVYWANKACRWEIKVDWASCPSQQLVYDYYTISDDTHRSRSVVGYCWGIAAGSKQIQIWVGSSPGYSGSDCYTGWNNSTWVIEAEEVN